MSDIIEYMVDSMVMDIGEELKDGVICVMYLNMPLHKIVYDDNTEDRYKESYNKDIKTSLNLNISEVANAPNGSIIQDRNSES